LLDFKDARMSVLEQFGHINQHLYDPGFLTESLTVEFQVNVRAAARIVKR